MRKLTRFEVARLARRAEVPVVASAPSGFDVSDTAPPEAAPLPAAPPAPPPEPRPLDINREGYRDEDKGWHPPPSNVKAYQRHVLKGCAACKAEAAALNVEIKVED